MAWAWRRGRSRLRSAAADVRLGEAKYGAGVRQPPCRSSFVQGDGGVELPVVNEVVRLHAGEAPRSGDRPGGCDGPFRVPRPAGERRALDRERPQIDWIETVQLRSASTAAEPLCGSPIPVEEKRVGVREGDGVRKVGRHLGLTQEPATSGHASADARGRRSPSWRRCHSWPRRPARTFHRDHGFSSSSLKRWARLLSRVAGDCAPACTGWSPRRPSGVTHERRAAPPYSTVPGAARPGSRSPISSCTLSRAAVSRIVRRRIPTLSRWPLR